MIRVFGRYVGVQLIAYAIDLGGFILASPIIGSLPANVASKIAAGIFAFLAHRRVTFKVHGQRNAHNQLIKYVLLLAANIPVSSGLLALLMQWISPAALAKVVSDVTCVAITFLFSHYIVFTERPPRGNT